MKKTIIYTIIAIACGVTAPQANAQQFAVKVYGDIGLGKGMSVTTALPGMTAKSSSSAFGADFGYTFWRQGGSSLEANIGLSYTMASATFNIPEMTFDYAAPAAADEDGNPYRRYTRLSDVSQKINPGYLSIPIYLQYQYRIAKWLGVHVDLGFAPGFRCGGSTGTTTGTANTYGVYQQYNQLVIKADYINDFGETYLDNASVGNADMKGFNASIIAGAGFEFYVYDPISIDLGIRYNGGLTDIFSGHYDIAPGMEMTAETAPVTYTVAEGQQVKALSDYVTKSRLNPLSLHVGVSVRF